MMLDLTLLKVKHAGEKEARKLLPYVGLCDAFSPESATLTERDAKLAEEDWRRFLKSMSHKRFIRNTTEIQRATNPPLIAEYAIRMGDYLFRASKPIIILERWTNAEHGKVNGLMREQRAAEYSALTALVCDDFIGFINESRRAIELGISYREFRDVHIAKNISNAEHCLRRDNPELRLEDPIRLTMALGYEHSLEDHITQPFALIRLVDDAESEISAKLMAQAKANDQMQDRDILAYTLALSASSGKISIGEEAIRHATLDELKEILDSHKRGLTA
jgi:hypothetical protein